MLSMRGPVEPVGLRVLRVSERIPPMRGGKEVHIAELTRAQTAAGHDVRVLYRAGDGSSLAAPATRITLPAVIRDVGGLPGTGLFSAAAARQARTWTAPDVVHIHGDLSEAWLLGRYARRAGAATVLTVHGGLNARYARPSRYPFRAIDAIIALGERVRVDLARCGVPDERVTIMSSGLNTEMIAAAHRQAVREPGLVVMVGSLDPVKNTETAIRAALAVPPSVELVLEVIGEGPRRRELRTLAQGSPRIRFLGQVSRAQVYQRIAAADAFVIASRRLPGKSEGVPTTLLEAMALGRAALVSTAATPTPVVTDPGSYLTFDPDDAGRLRELMVAAVTDAPTRVRLGARARSAVAHLGWTECAERVDAVYRRALAERRRIR